MEIYQTTYGNILIFYVKYAKIFMIVCFFLFFMYRNFRIIKKHYNYREFATVIKNKF